MKRRLNRLFFVKPSLQVSKLLLGKYIVRKIGRKTLAGKIVETEAYPGPYDKASHAYGIKKTPRNRAEYLEGGHIYIYLVYGMYWQLNISTGKEGYPECVLIRALEPIITNQSRIRIANNPELENIRESKLEMDSRFCVANGPGKLCRWLKLDKSFYGEDVTKSKRIWLSQGEKIKPPQIASGPRIGIDYAGAKWAKKPWRFYIKSNPCVSKR